VTETALAPRGIQLPRAGAGGMCPTEAQLAEFQSLVDWSSGSKLPDGRILGKADRLCDTPWTVEFVARRLEPSDKTILELGACDGHNTLALSRICRNVIGVEVRPRNVLGALTRLCLHGVSNAQIVVGDVRDVVPEIGNFDILYHTGVLYHLSNPVEHLFLAAGCAPTLFLGTHIASETSPPGPMVEIQFGNRSWTMYSSREFGWQDRLSGVESSSCWLTRAGLLLLLFEVGYRQVEIVEETECDGQPWIYVLAQR